jgi:large subunit ribosomal protein L30
MIMEEQKQSPKAEETAKPKSAGAGTGNKKFAAILVRGTIGFSREIKDTLQMLRLYKKNMCVLIQDTPAYRGMLTKVQSMITWGEVDDSTIKELKEKRGEKTKDKEGKEVAKPFYRLSPPRGGFERKGIKLPFKVGGALGYRGPKINDLIKRML